MALPSLPPPPDPHSRATIGAAPKKSRIYTLEATGVLIVAVIILIITLVRYWHNIAWSAR